MEEFIYNLNTYGNIKASSISENKINGLSSFIKALLFIIPAFYFLYKSLYKKKKKKFNSFDEINEYINNEEHSSAITQIIQGFVFIVLGIRLYFYFKPDNSQISLGLLIKYLQKKNIITDAFYNILKKFRPDGMSDYGS